MISRFCKSHGQRGSHPESYEEKYERRQERHEILLRKKNWTMCRLIHKQQIKEDNMLLQSPRQKEFLRRRNITIEELGRTEVQPLCDTKAAVIAEKRMGDSHRRAVLTYIRCSSTSQESWNDCITHLHPKSVQPDFSDGKLYSSPENMLAVKVSGNCRGTQTTVESSPIKKNSGQQTDHGTAVLDKEITQLSNYLKEALHRELLLNQKMVILQELLAVLLQAAEKSWKGQLNEDKLKCRLDTLENQLQICTQSYSKKSLKWIVLELEDQKQTYEQKVKESLQKLLEEKLQAERQLENAQRALAIAEEDRTLWKEYCSALKQDWNQLSDKHVELENKLYILENKLQWSDTQNFQLHQALQTLESERESLYSEIDNLQEDNRLTVQCLSAVESKLQTQEKERLMLETAIKDLHNEMHNQSM
ncbi:TRAF3-interacting JNK-activating modulator isoform X2 [Sceloporus undulatus]|uniref:TRAF3-interacting JNK-activating modulator isoform X2 n=1 Tax=Sceloporus undulatus TaxID=8520 RepID=UPI001C4C0F36|nr:TRAF3-interacting JNK-activating modulator isoform X2 [Sceloporus undulatus]